MTVDCPNSSAFDEAYARAKAQRLNIYRMDRMKGNAAGWVLHVQDAPMQRELITDAPQGKQGATVGSVVGGSNFQIVDTFPTGRPSSPGRVLYVNLEVQPAFFQRRLQFVANAKDVALTDNLDVWNLRGYAAPLWKLLPQMQERIDSAGYSLIVLDPIYKLYGNADYLWSNAPRMR